MSKFGCVIIDLLNQDLIVLKHVSLQKYEMLLHIPYMYIKKYKTCCKPDLCFILLYLKRCHLLPT